MAPCANQVPLPSDAVGPPVPRHAPTVRLGIIGCGRVADSHIPAALSASHLDLVALADSNSERLERVADSFGLSCFATTRPLDLVGRVDAVVLALPNHLHYPVGRELLTAGLHVLCEKPLANSTRDANRLCELAAARERVLAVGYVKRFEPNCGLMRRLLEEGFLGKLDRFEYEYGTPGGWAPLSNYNLLREQAGGGVLMTNGSHLLDRIIDWFGYPSRVAYSDDSHGGVEANCRASFVFGSGLTGVVTLSKTRQLENQFRLYGEWGHIEIAESQHASITFFPSGRSGVKHEITEYPEPKSRSDADYFRLQLEDFACAIQTSGRPRVQGTDGVASVELIEQCYRARTPLAEPWVCESLPEVTFLSHRRRTSAGEGDLSRTNKAQTVLVTGGNGFVGSRLCEVLHLGTVYQPRPFVHSSGKAAYVARYPLEFAHGDLTEFAGIRKAMDGCSLVVHLARGSDDVMIQGLKNVLRAAVEARVERFVHVSSVAVYGDNPPQSARYETAVPSRTGNPYGDIKLAQEQLVATYGRKFGLPFVILRPPHIFGPRSHFVDAVVERLRNGALPIVDGGKHVCNLVYVDNLIQAVLLSLEKPDAIGQTFFITDSSRVTWRRCLEDLGAALGIDVPHATAEQLHPPVRRSTTTSLLRMSRILLSNEFRSAAMELPGAAPAVRALYRGYAALPNKRRNQIRATFNPPEWMPAPTVREARYDATDYLIVSQRRGVEHSCEKAQRVLGYTAPVGYRQAMALTSAWMRFARIV